MNFIATTVDGENIHLKFPLKVEINKSQDAPADDLEVTFLNNFEIPEIKSIKAYNEGDLIFDGIVDVQEYLKNNKGKFLNIISRSKAAILLDNEAYPQVYYTPSLFTIFNRHVKPYGFSKFIGDDKSFSTKFIVNKGMSEWEVLENFCVDYLKINPQVTVDGVIDVSGKNKNKQLLFSNSKVNAIKYSSITISNKRYKIYSEVFAKEVGKGEYNLHIENDAAINRDIKRKRYINLTNNEKATLSYAKNVVKTSNESSLEINLNCPCKVFAKIGDLVNLDDELFNQEENLFVYKIKYILDSSSERTILTLRKGE